MTRSPQNAGRIARGFTLTEMAIVVGILALIAGMSASSLSSTSVGELRAASARIASMSRAAYDQAALSGEIHRLVIDLGDGDGDEMRKPSTVRVQRTSEQIQFDGTESLLSRAKPSGGATAGWMALSSGFALGGGGDDTEGAAPNLDGFLTGGVDELLGLVPSGTDSFGSFFDDDDDDDEGLSAVDSSFQDVGTPFMLDPGVSVLDVWTEGMDDPQRKGVAYIYFFPSGYSQDSLVHIGFSESERDDSGFTVKIDALSGLARVAHEYVEVPK